MWGLFNFFNLNVDLDIYEPLSRTPELLFNHTVESLTRDVDVKPLHSHNDYWRKSPLFDALGFGFQSIESDVWYFPEGYTVERTVTETTKDKKKSRLKSYEFHNDDIYVGHNQVFLKPEDTLFNMYLSPLYQFLTDSNPRFESFGDSNQPLQHSDSKHGVFYDSPETSLYFWLDFKTDPNETYNALLPYLKPFIDKGYLAYYDNEKKEYIQGPIVITITGNLPIELVESEAKRYVFLDAPLRLFNGSGTNADIERFRDLSVIASGSLEELLGEEDFLKVKYSDFNSKQRSKLKTFFDDAHSNGLKTRIWGGISWPRQIQQSHLKALFDEGCDLLNVDDLKYASESF